MRQRFSNHKASYRQVTVALLDVDGTLLDSNDAHANAWVEALNEFGVRREFGEVRKLIGMGSDHLVPALFSKLPDQETVDKISSRRGEIFREKYLPNLKPFPGTRELVLKLKKCFLTPVITTSASESDIEGLLKKCEIDDLIDLIVTSDDAEKSKPSPDIIRAGLDKAGCAPAYAIMIGDTPYDIDAATKARVKTVAFTSGGWSESELGRAIAIYTGPADLLKRFSESVFAEG